MTWQNYFPLSKGTTVFFNATIDKMNSRAKWGAWRTSGCRGTGTPFAGEGCRPGRTRDDSPCRTVAASKEDTVSE